MAIALPQGDNVNTHSQNNSDHLSFARRMLRGGSAAALSVAVMSSVAYAQDTTTEEGEIVTTGIRQSLENANAIKRNADSFVDAITAEDIGALPDRSVSEALQRVPGVSVLRFSGPDDPDHFSVEGDGVVIRGLPFVRSELNGRDAFAASPGGTLGFNDVSPELLGSVQVFKNQSADMIEGGLSGTIDLNTRKPFDQSDSYFGYSLDFTYSDLIEKVSPSLSFVGSKRWDTNIGEFGLLAGYSRNRLKSRSDASQTGDYRAYDENGSVVSIQDITGGERYIPSGGGIRTQEFDRERDGYSLAGQWASNDGRWEATAEFFRSESGTAWTENVIESSIDDAPTINVTDGVFDEDNLFQSGGISSPEGWRGPENVLPAGGGIRQLSVWRNRVEADETQDLAFNLKFTPTDQLRFNFDAQFVDSEASVTDLSFMAAAYANLFIDATGKVPQIDYIAPNGEQGFFDDPNNWYLRSKMDHRTENEADSLALRADVEYEFEDKGWLKSVQVGGRFADRDSLIRQSAFNWGNVSEIWTGRNNFGQIGNTPLITVADSNIGVAFGTNDFDNFQRGDVTSGGLGGFYWGGINASDYDGWADQVSDLLAYAYGSPQNVVNSGAATLANRSNAVDGGPFSASEISPLQQKFFSAYARADFGGDLSNGMSLSGNIGARYVRTEIDSNGTFEVASFDNVFGQNANRCNPDDPDREPGSLLPNFCSRDLGALQTFFGDGNTEERVFENSYDRILPSLNAKLNLNDDMLLRFGAARSMTRPDVLQLRSDFNVFEGENFATTLPGNPQVAEGVGLAAFTGNPFLNPIMSNQLDLSFEWYFGDSNSLTASVFLKEMEDYWIQSTTTTPLTNNGVTLDVTNNTTVNAEDTATIKGFEVAHQQFYDFLPGALSNFGTQANYTYIDADALANIDNTITGRFAIDGNSFERVSKHQFNVAGIYEDDRVSARLAYNWRDNFLLTRRDVIFPFASIYQKATGQVDGSFFYTINDNFKVGVTGSNLLNDLTETEQTINNDGLRAPRSFIINDRRFTLSLRANF